jgi:hypothetical protein
MNGRITVSSSLRFAEEPAAPVNSLQESLNMKDNNKSY